MHNHFLELEQNEREWLESKKKEEKEHAEEEEHISRLIKE